MAIASTPPPAPADPEALLRSVERRLREDDRFEVTRRAGGAVEVAWDGALRAALRALHLDGQVVLAILAPICGEAEADPMALLDWAGSLHAGAIALVDGAYVVRLAIPAGQVEATGLDRAVLHAARIAAALVPSFAAPRPGVAALFTHYGT